MPRSKGEMSSPPPPKYQAVVLIALFVVVVAAIGLALIAASDVRLIEVPMINGRTVIDRLFTFVFAAFFIYYGVRVRRADVAQGWAETSIKQEAFWAKFFRDKRPADPLEDPLPRMQGLAHFFSLMAFIVGGLLLTHEVLTLFVG